MPLSPLLLAIQMVCPLASAAIAIRLYRTGLYRRYPALFAYMLYHVPFGAYPLVLKTTSVAYFWCWCLSSPFSWTLDVLVTRELCRVVLERHRGICSLGRWVMYGGVALSAAITFLTMLPHIQSTLPARSRLIWFELSADRGISFGLAIFLLLMLVAVNRYPVRLSRNVLLNTFVFTVYYLGNTLSSLLFVVFDRRFSNVLDTGIIVVDAACMLVWLFCLTPAGEQIKVEWIHYGEEYERRMLDRLDSLNRVLQRAS